ncbi:Peptidoglycan-associated lipoprotein Pal-like protein (plasmid) [Candidatus Trichorickettsia mobilis]|uniref:OmpA family protein n=1 Tax=Candidatus Trichorickettsia mobilis TaxID=1346319 RepID=UPI002B25D085|nr:OmpA family protein [Candidatus Trichorickettsia mobilis]WPY01858.1 Peptidoglycan-associated lipoprotein Pal-like protein [Candidatus Trichorickettsia mobilis]
MFIKKAGLLLILFSLTSCSTKKTVIVIPEHNTVVEDESILRSDFEKNIGNKVYFAFDSAILSQEAKDRLKKQAEWLVAHSNVIATIEGHCDERGSRNYNLALGLRRAEAAEKFLITQGIDQRRLTVVTYGKDKPEVEGHNKNAWRLNRRAVAIIIKAQ